MNYKEPGKLQRKIDNIEKWCHRHANLIGVIVAILVSLATNWVCWLISK